MAMKQRTAGPLRLLENQMGPCHSMRVGSRKRVVQAEGIGKAMAIINERLTSQYLQHEAIEAQKAMVGSPNHSTVYLPVGPMGVPLVGTLEHGK